MILADYTETGTTGIYQLKRLWSKAMAGQEAMNRFPEELSTDMALIDVLGIGLLPTYQYLFEQKPNFEQFEQWVLNHSNGHIDEVTVNRCNHLFDTSVQKDSQVSEPVLSAADLAFWEKNGYVIVRQAITPEACAASRKVIYDYLEMEERDANSWYKDTQSLQGIMVPLYRHPTIDANRHAPKIKRAFEQLWNSTDLIVTADKCGFNPPEKPGFTYRGIGLHWDVNLKTPIPFGTQGILYLSDTESHQGALTVVPGFHQQLENWLSTLPEQVNPRQVDFAAYHPTPIAAQAGDCIIWNHLLPHGASPNRATTPRVVQYLNWYLPQETMHQEWI
jgi:hypothetical protein